MNTIETTHPVLACLDQLEASLKDVADVDPVFMRTDDKQQALLQVHRVRAQLDALGLRVIAGADDVAQRHGARDVAAWLAPAARLDRPAARREQRLAHALATRWQRLGAAHAAGDVTTEQAHAITHALDELPDDLDPDLRGRAEVRLVTDAAQFTPRQLRILGRRVLDAIAPEIGEDHERRRLDDDERRAARRTWLTTRDNHDGTSLIKGRLPTTVVDRLLTYLHAYTSPRRHGHHGSGCNTGAAGGASSSTGAGSGTGPEADGADPNTTGTSSTSSTTGTSSTSSVSSDRAPYPVRLGQALCAFLEHTDPTRHPLHGGLATTVMVTIDLDTLRTGLGVATTDTGEPITADQARRLACTAGIIPAVLGAQSEPLDLGRLQRLFQPAQRRAMALRDITCRAGGCDIPAAWCEAHHLHPWSTGGHTDLDDGILLCPHHHHRAHDPTYDMTRLPDGSYRFHRRT